MKTNKSILLKVLGTKAVVILLITGSTFAAFATLGDGKSSKKSDRPTKSLLSNKSRTNNAFSLRVGYNFRGSQVINTQQQRFVNLNTTLTYRKGTTTYVLPVQRKVFLDKIIFNDDLLRNNRRSH